MPGLVRKILIVAAADGLILQPLAQRNQRVPGPVQIDYKSHTINPLNDDDGHAEYKAADTLEAHGIIGFLNVFSFSYLIAIAQRHQVAQLWGKPVYVVTDVAFIPLQSYDEAQQAVRKASEVAKYHKRANSGEHTSNDLFEDADNDALTSLEDTWLDDEMTKDTLLSASTKDKGPGIAEGVISRKGLYGRFAERWFSRGGWTAGQRRNLGLSQDEPMEMGDRAQHRRKSSSLHASPALKPLRDVASLDAAIKTGELDATLSSDASDTERVTMSLLPKLLQTVKLLLLSRTFYYSYDFDISRRLSTQGKALSDLPVYKQFDAQYFWNRHLIEPLITGGYDEYVLPVMQGFIGQRGFPVDSAAAAATGTMPEQTSGTATQDQGASDFLLTLISRRTTRRAGFRYLRRGVDEDGNVANGVETEQILSKPAWTDGPVHSFVQTRGSMPLFFMQTPYTFKPIPNLHESSESNKQSMKKHFNNLMASYGSIQAVSLIDKHGVENKIGVAYEDYVRSLNSTHSFGQDQQIGFNWFDFHNICRGMKFENVAVLINELAPFLSTSGWTTKDESEQQRSTTQSGIVRTNCMDCLDRTNVVQSAIALHTLHQQLASSQPAEPAQASTSPSTLKPGNDPQSTAFNALWADNGDSISLSYAGTAALKGDYVRTRKRTALGLLSDLSLTLSRYYRNLFDDFFAQAALDYVLGNVSPDVFVEFQSRMSTADPAVDLTRARQSAVMTAANVIISDREDLLAGWAVEAPAASRLETALAPEPPTASASVPASASSPAGLRAQPLHEVLLLLSDRALYTVAYNWDAEKVRGFERVELSRVRRVLWGTYITETNTAGQTDGRRNAGLKVEFDADADMPSLRRLNTRTVGGLLEGETAKGASGNAAGAAGAVGAVGSTGPAGEVTSTATEADPTSRRIIAFKILPRQTSVIRSSSSVPAASSRNERELAQQICEDICRAAATKGDGAAKTEGGETDMAAEERDIVSLEDAKKSTTLVETIEYGLKKLVWG